MLEQPIFPVLQCFGVLQEGLSRGRFKLLTFSRSDVNKTDIYKAKKLRQTPL